MHADLVRRLDLCPFCEGEAVMLRDHKKIGTYIACKECHCATETMATKDGATKVWNRRAQALECPVAQPDEPEHFLTAYASKDGRETGIDHPTDADWNDVMAAHVGLRDWLNDRIANQGSCPHRPVAQPVPVAWRVEVQRAIDFIVHLKEQKARFVLENLLSSSSDNTDQLPFADATPQPASAGPVVALEEEDAEVDAKWRDLALQFDGHRIEALALLRYVSEAGNANEAIGRAGEIRAFLSKPPLSGEAVLAARIAALSSPTPVGVSEAIPESLADAETRIMQEYRWGNLTPLGVANHLRRAGFRSEVAVAKANSLEAALRSQPPAVKKPTAEEALAAMKKRYENWQHISTTPASLYLSPLSLLNFYMQGDDTDENPDTWRVDTWDKRPENATAWCLCVTPKGPPAEFFEPAVRSQQAAPKEQEGRDDTHAFKNFHRLLCERFGYTHDEVDWRRDQVSLIEWIAKLAAPKEPAPGVTEASLLAEMAKHTGWELDWGEEDPNWEGSECGWRVHQRSGNTNDREWKRIGYGPTPAAALQAAMAARP